LRHRTGTVEKNLTRRYATPVDTVEKTAARLPANATDDKQRSSIVRELAGFHPALVNRCAEDPRLIRCTVEKKRPLAIGERDTVEKTNPFHPPLVSHGPSSGPRLITCRRQKTIVYRTRAV
jgi:hypothetical protein